MCQRPAGEQCSKAVDHSLGGRTFRGDRLKVIEWADRFRVGREGTPRLTVVNADGITDNGAALIDEIVRGG